MELIGPPKTYKAYDMQHIFLSPPVHTRNTDSKLRREVCGWGLLGPPKTYKAYAKQHLFLSPILYPVHTSASLSLRSLNRHDATPPKI